MCVYHTPFIHLLSDDIHILSWYSISKFAKFMNKHICGSIWMNKHIWRKYFSYLCLTQGVVCRPSHCSPLFRQVLRSCLHTFPTLIYVYTYKYLHVHISLNWNMHSQWAAWRQLKSTTHSPCSSFHSAQTSNPSEAAVLMLMCWEENQSNEQPIQVIEQLESHLQCSWISI